MKAWAIPVLVSALAGCASAPVERHPDPIFHDQWFAQPAERISADDLFAMSEEMRQYLATEIVPGVEDGDARQVLFERLYVHGRLKLEYDATFTRNAAEAFAAQSGNCLSLVVLTAAFAKQLEVPVRFQMVYVDEDWSRRGGIEFFTEHVNVILGAKAGVGLNGGTQDTDLIIDFLPPDDLRTRRTRRLAENTIVAMYMNNRAAESLNEAPFNRAYWWARAAISQDPAYMPAYNTLGIIYKLHGNLPEAQAVFDRILQLEPENTIAMGNQVMVLRALGLTGQAEAMDRRLKAIRPYPPFYFFDRGVAAMKRNEFAAGRDLFIKQIQRDASNSQSHFWLGLAYFHLGDMKKAEKEFVVAINTSTTIADRELYTRELEKLRSGQR